MKISRLFLFLFMIVFLFMGCKFVQINPSTDVNSYEILGQDIGIYMKTKKPDVVKRTEKWVKGITIATDAEIFEKDALQVMYKYILKEMPENAEIILMAKSTLNILGVKINLKVSELSPEGKIQYLNCVQGLVKGYLQGIK